MPAPRLPSFRTGRPGPVSRDFPIPNSEPEIDPDGQNERAEVEVLKVQEGF